MRALFGEETDSLHANVTGSSVPINQETPAQQTIFALHNQRPSSTETHLTNMFEAGSTFGLESPIQIHPGAYQLNSVSEVRRAQLSLTQLIFSSMQILGGFSELGAAYSVALSSQHAFQELHLNSMG